MIDFINNWFGYIQDRYGVSPLIFGIIYLISFAPCWYCVFKIIRAFKRKNRKALTFWVGLFALFFAAPYAYVYFFGRNYPLWFHVIFGLIVAVSVLLTVKQIKRRMIPKTVS